MIQISTTARGSFNAELTRHYWTVDQRQSTEFLGGERAQCGSQFLGVNGCQLPHQFGWGFEVSNLHPMVKFVQALSDAEIVSTLSTQLSWCNLAATHERQPGEEALDPVRRIRPRTSGTAAPEALERLTRRGVLLEGSRGD